MEIFGASEYTKIEERLDRGRRWMDGGGRSSRGGGNRGTGGSNRNR